MSHYIKFSCVYCGQHIECDPSLHGRQFHCPGCKQKIVVPPRAAPQSGHAVQSVNDTWDTEIPDPNTETPTRYLWRKDAPPDSPGARV
jgi:DNA-directed RNA polymerase subunit RPC12/RpoP